MNRILATDHGSAGARPSFVLLLVLVFIVLAGSLLVLMTGGTAQFMRTCRQEHTSLILRQLIDSGRAWADAHDLPRPEAGPIELDAIDILPSEATGSVTIVAGPEKPEVVIIEAQFELRGRSYARKAAFPIAPGRS